MWVGFATSRGNQGQGLSVTSAPPLYEVSVREKRSFSMPSVLSTMLIACGTELFAQVHGARPSALDEQVVGRNLPGRVQQVAPISKAITLETDDGASDRVSYLISGGRIYIPVESMRHFGWSPLLDDFNHIVDIGGCLRISLVKNTIYRIGTANVSGVRGVAELANVPVVIRSPTGSYYIALSSISSYLAYSVILDKKGNKLHLNYEKSLADGAGSFAKDCPYTKSSVPTNSSYRLGR